MSINLIGLLFSEVWEDRFGKEVRFYYIVVDQTNMLKDGGDLVILERLGNSNLLSKKRYVPMKDLLNNKNWRQEHKVCY